MQIHNDGIIGSRLRVSTAASIHHSLSLTPSHPSLSTMVRQSLKPRNIPCQVATCDRYFGDHGALHRHMQIHKDAKCLANIQRGLRVPPQPTQDKDGGNEDFGAPLDPPSPQAAAPRLAQRETIEFYPYINGTQIHIMLTST